MSGAGEPPHADSAVLFVAWRGMAGRIYAHDPHLMTRPYQSPPQDAGQRPEAAVRARWVLVAKETNAQRRMRGHEGPWNQIRPKMALVQRRGVTSIISHP